VGQGPTGRARPNRWGQARQVGLEGFLTRNSNRKLQRKIKGFFKKLLTPIKNKKITITLQK
jgi:hypothetical protein